MSHSTKSEGYLAKDGYLDIAAISALQKDIDKMATNPKTYLKPTGPIYYTAKVIPKFDKAKTKGDKAEVYERKRAQPVKERKSMPKAGQRMKMQVLLRSYKDLEETDFWKAFKAAEKAVQQHAKLAEKFVAQYKKEGAKKREKEANAFDKAIDAFIDILNEAGIEEDDIAIGKSTMGKTMCIKVGKGMYVSIGKADEEKFDKTIASNEEDEDDKPKKKGKSGKKSKDDDDSGKKKNKKKAKSRDDEDEESDDEDEEPVKKSKKSKKVKTAKKVVARKR